MSLTPSAVAVEPVVEQLPLSVEEAAIGRTRKRLPRTAWLAAGWLLLVVIAAALAPLLPISDPNASDFGAREGMSTSHWFGTDGNGRDVLARVVFGARSSLLVGFATVAIGIVVGGSLGLISGYYRGRIGDLLDGLFDTMLAVPALVLVSALVAVMAGGPGVTTTRRMALLIVGIGVVAVPIIARITRASALSWSQREFVKMALTAGASHRRVLLREVLPNVLPAMFSISLLAVADVIVAEGSLSILGVGVPLPTPSWGNIIAEGKSSIDLGGVHLVAVPASCIFLTVLALNYLGDVVRERTDVRGSLL
jgi:peptide/nickel transport system permease protein